MPTDHRPRGPWPLEPNRVSRFYTGGRLLDRLRGVPEPEARDTNEPEDWLASVTPAWSPPGAPATDEGLSHVDPGTGPVLLRTLLEREPAAIGGSALVRRAGPTTGLLVKLLDAAVRLPVHCHPSRAFARRHLDSYFGKAEAWVVLATRRIPGAEAPNVRLGFRRELATDELRGIVDDGETERLLRLMHRLPTRAGDTWFVPPGLPHAIGAGVLIAEIQEPADVSILAETRDVPVTPIAVTAGLPQETALEAFDRRRWDEADVGRLRQEPAPAATERGLRRSSLLGAATEPYFRAERVIVDGLARPWSEEAFLVGIVTEGSGTVAVDGAVLELRPGITFAVPAVGLPHAEVEAGSGPLTILAALPPRPEALDADPAADR